MAKLEIKNIWYEFDEWSDVFDAHDCNSDVIFELSDESKWGATFYTYQNLLSLSEKNSITGECLSGQYFYADKPIFISKMNKDTIVSTIKDILEKEDNLSDVFWEIER